MSGDARESTSDLIDLHARLPLESESSVDLEGELGSPAAEGGDLPTTKLEPDTLSVFRGCNRLQEFITSDDALDKTRKFERHLILSLLIRLPEGHKRAHTLFKHRSGYDLEFLDEELARATSRQPATCEEYNEYTKNKCSFDCALFKVDHIVSPLDITKEDYIPTEATGFWVCKTRKGKANPVPVEPCYKDLMSAFERQNEFVTISDSGIIYIYKDRHWQAIENSQMKSFSQTKMNPRPKEHHRKEFLSLLKCSNLREPNWFSQSSEGLINLQNGIYNISQDKLTEHSSEFGFRYQLPYDYDPSAEAPAFEQFLYDVTLGRHEMSKVLMEFAGYALASGPCYTEKALILFGSGANGKSTFMDTLKALAGKDNYSSLSLTALNKDTKRYMVDGKLFNIGEETNVRALGDSEVFKTMVTGGEIDVKKLFVQDYVIKNTCKLIMACNELPKSSDRSDGLYRRMLLVPFEAKFNDDIKDPKMREKLKEELPGIFNLAIEGYKRLIKSQWQFSNSLRLNDAIENYKLENDNILAWYHDRIEKTGSDDDTLFKDELYRNYQEFCTEEGGFTVHKNIFFKAIRDRIVNYKEIKRIEMPSLKRKRAVVGIIYKND